MIVMLTTVRMQGLLVSPRMIADHYTTSVLRVSKAVDDRLAQTSGASTVHRGPGMLPLLTQCQTMKVAVQQSRHL